MKAPVNNLSRITTLIDAASAVAGSRRKLAKALGYSNGNLSGWFAGTRTCPVEAQALMADMAGLDAEQTTLYAVIDGERNPQRKEALFRVLGKAYRQHGGAALSAMFASAIWVSDAGAYLIRCILC